MEKVVKVWTKRDVIKIWAPLRVDSTFYNPQTGEWCQKMLLDRGKLG